MKVFPLVFVKFFSRLFSNHLDFFQLHGTYRQKDRIYREDIFFGKGKSINEASKEELDHDISERISENPLAYTGNKLHFELTEEDIKDKKSL